MAGKMQRWGLILIVGALITGGIWWTARPSPAELLERGLAAERRHAGRGELLLRQALDRAGGRYPDAACALCVVHALHDDWTTALREFSELDLDHCRTDLLLEFSRAALEAGQERSAVAALEAVGRRQNRDSSAAFETLAANYQATGEVDLVIEAARQWARLDPDNPQAWIQLIQTLKQQPRRDAECLAAVREALTHDLPDDVLLELKYRLVEQWIVCGDATQARQAYSALREVAGDSFRTRLFEIDLCRLEGRPEESLELMNRIFPEVRNPAEAHFNRSVIYQDLGRYADAAQDLERTLALQPQNAAAHFKLSEAYRAQGHAEPARRHRELAEAINARESRISELQRMARVRPDDPAIPRQLADLFREQGQTELARQWQARAELVATEKSPE